MPVNVSPEYAKAEKEYLNAGSLEEKLEKLKELIRHAPTHKGGENLRAQLNSRRKKLEEEIERRRKISKASGGKSGTSIKKEEMQAVIVGKTGSGKSSFLKMLTKAEPKVSDVRFTTKAPVVGILDFFGANIQLIEVPAIESEYYDRGLVYTSDVVIIFINKIEEIPEIEKRLASQGKKLIILNIKEENFDKRKAEATLKSKYKSYESAIICTKTAEGIKEAKNKIFAGFGKIRIYTKEPGKEKSERPIILNPKATVRMIAEKIFKTSVPEKIVKESKVTGPSSKFPNQVVGLNHQLKDMDIIEFRTK